MDVIRTASWLASASVALVLISGCVDSSRSEGALRLPQGDFANGKTAFLDLGCVRCHSVHGEDDLPAPDGPIRMELGGELIYVTGYAELVTAIIHPSHSISGRAPKEMSENSATDMTSFNDRMTVAEMIDLVTFLHTKYRKLVPGYNPVPF